MELQLRIQTVWRTEPTDDESVGLHMVGLIKDALERGGAPPAAVVLREERFDIVYLDALAAAKVAPVPFIASLTHANLDGAGAIEAVALIGTFGMRRGGERPIPVAMAFVEWADGRWWRWQSLLDPGTPPRDLRDDTETVLRAIDGDGKPLGLGGWWSLARRHGWSLELRPTTPQYVH